MLETLGSFDHLSIALMIGLPSYRFETLLFDFYSDPPSIYWIYFIDPSNTVSTQQNNSENTSYGLFTSFRQISFSENERKENEKRRNQNKNVRYRAQLLS